eukprot:gene58184-biopygen41790
MSLHRNIDLASATPVPRSVASADPSQPMDVIFIEGYTGQTVIGIHDTELHRPQTIVVDVHAGLPRAKACETDRIGDTIDYGGVRERLQALYRDHKLTLLESFAETKAEEGIVECDLGSADQPEQVAAIDRGLRAAIDGRVDACRAQQRMRIEPAQHRPAEQALHGDPVQTEHCLCR